MSNEFRRMRFNSGVGWVTALASFVGLTGFLYPFVLPAVARADDRSAHAADAPYLFALVTVLCVVAIAVELERPPNPPGPATQRVPGPRRPGGRGEEMHRLHRSASKSVALLGVLVATDATLRLVPSFLGGSPIFLLVMLVGAVFGPAFGFQMGALTLLVSAFITGGVGPWLPYEMLGVGWVGMTAGWLPRLPSIRRRLFLLAAFGALWGFLYGAVLNLWSWPFAAPGLEGDVGLYWSPSLSFGETLSHYGRFYLVTSLWYDLFRAVGNAVLVLTLGGPALRVLERFRSRFTWEPWVEMNGTEVAISRPLDA